MKKTLKLLCGIICLLSVVLITLSGCDMGNLFDGSVNVPKGDGFTPVYYGMLMSTSPDVEIPPVSYEDVVKENAGNNGNHNGWYKKPDKDKENNGNTDNNGNHYGWYKDDNGDGKLDEDFQQQLCYLSQNQDVYFYVGIGNPAQLEIVSIQINGKTYTSDMFEANSTNEVKILKHNVGNAGGIVEYTIEEIKYSDGTEVKDVVLAGNKTARAGIKVENAVTATVNNIELRDSGKEIFFDITIADDYSLIANSNGVITVTVYRDGKSVKSTELIVGKNEVTIETLNKNKEHEYEIVAYYDDLSGEGATYHTLISRRPVQEIHTHTFDVWTVTKEASCTEDGEKMRTCTACGEIKTEKISATGHKWSNDCDTMCNVEGCGFTRETEHQFNNACDADCNVCGEIRVVLGHVYDNACDADCNVCGEIRVVLGHVYDNECDADCNVCGATRVVLGHVYDNACDTDCNVCGFTRVTDHTYDDQYDAVCNVCGFVRDAECAHKNIITLPGKEANCIETGLTEGQKCGDCGETIVEQTIIPVTGIHNYESEGTPSSDYATVLVTYTCSTCGHTYSKSVVPTDFTVTADNRAMIGFTGEANENLVIPAVFEDNGTWYRVNAIGDSAFYSCENLTSVTIGDAVTTIGDSAFRYCFSLESVTIPDSVTTIGNHTFETCSNLTSVIIPDSVITIGDYAFWGCYYLSSVTIGDSVTTISKEAFSFCPSLTSITIPDSVIVIGDGAFDSCSNLTSITIPNSVTSIGRYVFRYCSSLTSVTIPNSVIIIDVEMFSGCTNLTSVTVGDSVISIGDFAFYNCDAITHVYYVGNESDWESISIGQSNDSFINATRYYYSETQPTTEGNFWHYVDGVPTVWEVHIHTYESKGTPSADYATVFVTYTCSGCGDMYSETITPTDFTVTAENRAMVGFTGATNENLVIPAVFEDNGTWYLVTEIGHRAFYGCENLVSVTIPDSVTSIGGNAFATCYSLKFVHLGNGIEYIGTCAFDCCHILEEIVIGKGPMTIINHAFYECDILSKIYFYGEKEEFDSITVDEIGNYKFTDATRYYYSETQPTTEGNFWHYVDGVPTVWEAHKHTEAILSAVAPTCTETGLTEGKYCSTCGKVLVEQIIVPMIDHTYDDQCDTNCNVCGVTRVVPGHVFDHDCDTDCNICGEIRMTEHIYDNACDTDCNVCGATRVVPGHAYDNDCDADCNECGYTRVTDHTYDDQYDAVCNVCGFVRDAECAHKNVITLPEKEANCIETGLSEGQKCGDCGETIVEQTILPATGIHTYENGVCVICKYKRFSEGLEYTSNGDGTCYVSGFGTCTDTDIIIPSVSPNGETVIGVGDRAFGYMAFPISSVVIPDSVTIIGREAFAWCEALTSVTIGNKVTHIGSFAFGCCSSLEKIDIPQSVTQIELDAFQVCDVLSCIEVSPDNKAYRSIDGNLYTKDGKELVKYAAGKNDTTFIIPDGVETIGVYSVYYSTKITNIVMPDSVISIQAWAFQGCTSLTNVKLSNNIESIGYEAFGDCSSLMTIVIPNSIKTIGGNFFNWLSVLETAYYEGCESDWSKISIEENEYFFKATLYYYSETQPTTEGNFWHYVDGVPTVWEVEIHTHSYTSKGTPSADYATVSVTYTCSGCGHTYSETITPTDFTVTAENRTMVGFTGEENENLVIPAVFEDNGTWYRVTCIGLQAFYECVFIERVELPVSVKYIQKDAFYNCHGIETVVLNEGLVSIGDWAFYGSTSLESIYIPSTVESIDKYTFLFCTDSVNTITVHQDNKYYHSEGNCLIETATNSLIQGCKNSIIPNYVTTIFTYAFQYCSELKEIVIPKSVIEIEECAFFECNSLVRVYYAGTEDDWNKIAVDYYDYSPELFNATRYYYSETQPTTEGNFWHYVDGVPTVWEVYVAPNYSLGLEYTSNGDGTCYVSGIGTCKDADIIIPSTYDGLLVTAIGQNWNYVFGNNQNIRSVVIPDTVTYIDLFAFSGCENLESVTLGSNTFVDEMAFLDCTSLKTIHLPGNASVGGRAFDGCTALESITVDNAHPYYKSIDGNLYNKQGTLLIQYALGKSDTSFILPDGVTEIGHYALSGAKNLKHIVLSYGLTTIGTAAFSNCNSLESIIIPASVTSIGIFNQEFAASGPVFAFAGCNNLNAIYYEGSVADWSQISIELEWDGTNPFDNIFRYYYSATQPTTEGNFWHYVDGVPTVWEIHIHNYTSVVTTEPTATANGIATYTCSCGDSYTEELVPQDFTVTSNNREMVGYTGEENENLVIPAVFEDNGTWYRVTTIGDDAFIECSNLASVTIPDSVTSIGYMSFYSCDNLTSVTIPNSVTSIGERAFFDCSKLASAVIPDSVTIISDYAFYDCTNLTSVTIGDSVTIIGDYAFYSCSNLTNVTIGDSVTIIGDHAFRDCTNLTSVIIGDSVITIGVWAFAGCDNLTSATIGNSVTIIGEWAFWRCINLTSVTIGDSVITIGNTAFSQCHSLTNVKIGESVTTIGDYAFSDCYTLTSIIIPDSVNSIGADAFDGCDALKSVTIGNSVTSIGNYAFSGCNSLTSVYISDVAAWCHIVFGSGNSSPLVYTKNLYLIENGEAELITDLIVPDSVTSIGYMAFYNCSNITSVTIGDSVNTIGDKAFYNCSNITSVTIGDSVNTIGDWVFYLCWKLKSITFEGTVEQWNAIEKGEGWNNSITATEVICSDGVVSLV